MNKIKLVAALLIVPALTQVQAEHDDRRDHRDARNSPDHYASARVVEVRPLYRYERVNRPSKDCWYEEQEREERSSDSGAGKTILGGIIGGALGSRVGKGDGKKAATVLGAIVGAKIASDSHKRKNGDNNDEYVESRRVCRRVNQYHEERRIVGFRVRYDYRGQIYKTETRRHPGDRLRLRVQVTPAE